MKNNTKQLLKRKWTGPIDKSEKFKQYWCFMHRTIFMPVFMLILTDWVK